MLATYQKRVVLLSWWLLSFGVMHVGAVGPSAQETKAVYAVKGYGDSLAPWQRELGAAFRKKWVVKEFPGSDALVPILQSQGLSVSLVKGEASPGGKGIFLPNSCDQKITPLVVSSPFPLYFISKNGFSSFNIVMKVPHILSLNTQDQKHFYHMILSVGEALKQMGYADYFMFVDFSKNYGEDQMAGMGYVEFIPQGYNAAYVPGQGRTEDVFVDHKIKRTGYALFRICMTAEATDLARVKEFERTFTYKRQDRAPGSAQHATFPWKGGRKNYGEALKVGVYQLMHLLQDYEMLHFEDISPATTPSTTPGLQGANANIKPEKKGASLQKTSQGLQKDSKKSIEPGSKTLSEKIKSIVTELSPNVAKSCAFCTPTVLERQAIYASPISRVLYNFRPYFENGHFMIVPKEHKDNFQDITWQEFQDMYQQARCLTQIAEDTGTVLWFMQNGPQAGQTQPHIHFHVLLRSRQPWEFFVHLAFELTGASKMLMPQDYDRVREKVRPLCGDKKALATKVAA